MSERPEIVSGVEAERRLRPLTIRQALGWLVGAAGGSVFVAWCASPAWVWSVWPLPVGIGFFFGCLAVFPVFLLLARLGRSPTWVIGGCILAPAFWSLAASEHLGPQISSLVAVSVFTGCALLLGLWDPPRLGRGVCKAK